MLRIDNSLKVVKGVLDEKETKTLSFKREIMLSNATMEALREYKFNWLKNLKKSYEPL